MTSDEIWDVRAKFDALRKEKDDEIEVLKALLREVIDLLHMPDGATAEYLDTRIRDALGEQPRWTTEQIAQISRDAEMMVSKMRPKPEAP